MTYDVKYEKKAVKQIQKLDSSVQKLIKTWIEKVKGATIIIGYDIVNEDGIVNVHAVSEHPITDRNLKPIRIRRDLPELYAILKEEEK